MKKLAIISLCMLLALSVKAGKVDTVLVHSTVMNKDVKTVVITPTETKKNRDQRYPVLYLLHGFANNGTVWGRYTAPRATASIISRRSRPRSPR